MRNSGGHRVVEMNMGIAVGRNDQLSCRVDRFRVRSALSGRNYLSELSVGHHDVVKSVFLSELCIFY